MVLVLDNSDKTSSQSAAAKLSLAGLSRERLRAALVEAGVPEKQLKMRVGQLWRWLYIAGATSFDEMTDISKDTRGVLASKYSLDRPEIVAEQISIDGTRKWLLRLPRRGHEVKAPEIETVYIPEEDRGTLCISSQVGCTLTCSFCHTGTQRLVRNLEASEIVGQIMLARDRIGDWPGAAAPGDGQLCPRPSARSPTSCSWAWASRCTISRTSKRRWTSPPTAKGISLSKRRITLSTSGVVPEITRWGEE